MMLVWALYRWSSYFLSSAVVSLALDFSPLLFTLVSDFSLLSVDEASPGEVWSSFLYTLLCGGEKLRLSEGLGGILRKVSDLFLAISCEACSMKLFLLVIRASKVLFLMRC